MTNRNSGISKICTTINYDLFKRNKRDAPTCAL